MPNLSVTQWINVGVFALSSLATASWWVGLYSPEHATMVSGGLLWFSSTLNFVLTGKPIEAKQ